MQAMLALSSVISLAGLAWLLLWLWRDYCIDAYRQRLFALRDELFDLASASAHGLSFPSPAYAQLRATLNGLIRFSSKVDLVAIGILSLRMRGMAYRPAAEFDARWARNLGRLDAEGGARLESLRQRMHLATAHFAIVSVPHLLVLGVPILLAFVGAVLVRAVLHSAVRAVPARLSALRARMESMYDAAAFDEGLSAA